MTPDEEILDSPEDWVARHIHRYVTARGEDAYRYSGNDLLLLTTRGRRSGRLRRTALICGRHDAAYVVVASNGGRNQHPQWYLNLAADPRVYVQFRELTLPARARTAAGAERSRLWAMMEEGFPQYGRYQQRTRREIPVVVLDPT